jgi:hypothetical protein
MHAKIDVPLDPEVVKFRPKADSGKLGAAVLKNSVTGEFEEVHPAACVVFIGLDPTPGSSRASSTSRTAGSSRRQVQR